MSDLYVMVFLLTLKAGFEVRYEKPFFYPIIIYDAVVSFCHAVFCRIEYSMRQQSGFYRRSENQVLDKCGEPISKEEIELDSYKRRRKDNYRFLEQWIYEFHHGYYDVLTFKGGKLIKIESMIPK